MKKIIINLLFIAVLKMFCFFPTFAQESDKWEIKVDPDMPHLTTIETIELNPRTIPFLSKVEKIWDESLSGLPYNAFTDIIRFRGAFYCTFREGEIHMNHETGRVRVIKSSDGKKWETVGLFEWDGGDVRDAKLSITAEGHLLLNSSIYYMSPGSPYGRQSVTWLTPDGDNWSSVYSCNSGINTWRWSVTWYNGVGYSIGYSGKDSFGTLYTTRDGKTWEILVENFFPGGQGNESSIVFGEDDIAHCLLRDGPGGMAQFGTAKPPYTEWTWKDLGGYAGGPKMIRLKDGRFLAVIRTHDGGLPPSDIMPGNSPTGGGHTSLVWIDPEKGLMKEFLALPSGGRGGSSYGGLVEHDGIIWISDYSSHENMTDKARPSIYLAKVKLAPK